MELAVTLAEKCPDQRRIQPRASAVLARGGHLLATAYRGEDHPGQQVEVTILSKTGDADLQGATLYLTIEPFASGVLTNTDMIIQRGIKRVVIATLNPDPAGRGLGELHLQQAGVAIGRFDADLAARFLEINVAFSALHPIEPVIRMGHRPLKSPRGHALSRGPEGELLEFVPDAASPTGYRPRIFLRGHRAILEKYEELRRIQLRQLERDVIGLARIEAGLDRSLPDAESGRYSIQEEDEPREQQRAASDYECGFIGGQLNALAFAMGGILEEPEAGGP